MNSHNIGMMQKFHCSNLSLYLKLYVISFVPEIIWKTKDKRNGAYLMLKFAFHDHFLVNDLDCNLVTIVTIESHLNLRKCTFSNCPSKPVLPYTFFRPHHSPCLDYCFFSHYDLCVVCICREPMLFLL